jgi:hypothetical protein
MRLYDGLLRKLVLVHRSLLELIRYQSPYTTALATVFAIDPDTTMREHSCESHMVTQNCNLCIRLGLLAEQTCLGLEQFD